MLKLKLTAEQTDELTFPVGCLVWYNFTDDDDVESPIILKQGSVESVTLDYGSKNLIYTVVYIHEHGKIIDEIIEHDNSVMSSSTTTTTTNMAYGTNCPVIIDSKYDGIVLLPEQSCGGEKGAKTFHYTVMIQQHSIGAAGQSRYEFGVEAHRIKYRKVVVVSPTTVVTTGQEELSLLLSLLQDDVAAAAVVATPNHHASSANNNGGTALMLQPTTIIGQTKKKTVVPSLITVEADGRKRNEMDESPLTITPPMRDSCCYHNVSAAAHHANAIVAPRSIDKDLNKHETSKSFSINGGSSNVIRDDGGGGTHRSFSEGINSSNVSRDGGGNSHRSSEDVDDNKIVMIIAEWIQWNRDYCRQDLFFHLIGSKHDKKEKITVQDIAHETKCKVVVNCPKSSNTPLPCPFTITIWTACNEYGHDYFQVGGPINPATCILSELEIHDMIRKRMECKFRKDFNSADSMQNILQQAGVFVHDATGQWRADGKDEIEVGVHRKPYFDIHRLTATREKVQDLLLDYLDIIDDPGAKGRLSYETALKCTGCHRPLDSTSCAVEWNGPNWSGFISLVELAKCNVGRLFNASTILDEQEGQNIQRLGCSIKMYGEPFGVPLKYCDPYLLVSGGTWQNVDKAVEIVRNAILNRHVDQSQSVPPQPPPYHGGGIPQFDMAEEIKPAERKAKRRKAKRHKTWRKHQEQQKDDSQLSPPTQCEQNAVELSIDTTLPINDALNKYNQDIFQLQKSRDSSSNNSEGGKVNEIVMKAPEWIQSNRQKQQDLFFHLVGSKLDIVGKVTVLDIARETNCKIRVKCPDGKSPNYNFFPISITITDRTSRYEPTLDLLDQAREKVLELLLSFLDVKHDVGAKGRLTYDVLSSYDGPHLLMDSTSNAVQWRSPKGALRFLSLIELPFVHCNLGNDFYVNTILQACKSQRMKSLGCLVKGYGDSFGMPLRSCGPYALVSGASWQAVDESVVVVQAFIKRDQHQLSPPALPLSQGTPHTSENALLPSHTTNKLPTNDTAASGGIIEDGVEYI